MLAKLRARDCDTHNRGSRLVLAVMGITTLAVFALYVCTLGKQSLWFDEGLSVNFSARPMADLLDTLIHQDIHPPLYYLLLHFWMPLAGNSELAVRLPSAFAAVLLVPLAFAVVRETWGTDGDRTMHWTIAGTAAAALMGASPFIAFYAQETRMYSMVAALTLATTWAFLRALRTPARRRWVVFSTLLAASLYTQYMAAFVIPAFWLYVLFLERNNLWRTTVYTAIAGILCLPWVHPGYLQLGRLIRVPDYWVGTRVTPALFLRAMSDSLLPSSAGRLAVLAAGLAILLIARFLVRAGFSLSARARRSVLLFLTFLIPLALTYAMVAIAPKFATRYAIVAVAPLYICLALGLYALLGKRSPPTRALFGLLVIVAVSVSLRSTVAVVTGRKDRRDDTRALAAYLTENAQNEDALLLVANAPYAFQYYYQGSAPWHGLHVGQTFQWAARLLNSILETRPRRVWLVHWHHEFADPADMVVTELMRVGSEVEVGKRFWGYELRAFDVQDYEHTITASPQAENEVKVDFTPGLRILGFDRLGHSDGRLQYVLYWQALQPLDRNYSLTLGLQDQEGNEYLRKDQALSTDYFLPPVWPLNVLIRGRVDLELPPDLPPIAYRVNLQVWDPESLRNLECVDAHGEPQGQTLFLEELTPSKTDLSATLAEIPNPFHADVGSGLELLGFDLPRDAYYQGDTARLTLWWKTPDTPRIDHPAMFYLLDSHNSVVWRNEAPIILGHPLTSWQPGEVNRVMYRLATPADLPEGEYSLQAGTAHRLVPLATLHINSREHLFDMPSMQHTLDAQFAESISLLGYDLRAPEVHLGEEIMVTLYWQSQQRIAASYKVSVQVLSDELQIMAQQDSVPAQWTRPTTAWLPGEIVIDEHILVLKPGAKPGNATLIVALYDEQGGQRALVELGGKVGDHAVLADLSVGP